MTGRRSHGRLSALNGVVHQGNSSAGDGSAGHPRPLGSRQNPAWRAGRGRESDSGRVASSHRPGPSNCGPSAPSTCRTAAKLCRPGGVRAVIAENLLLKQQLIVLRRPRKRAPNLTTVDRLLCGFGSLFLGPGRLRKVAIGVRPSTLLAFHRALVHRKYRRLFSSSHRPRTPGPKGPSDALIRAIVELKSRNPRFGCPRIARIISRTFGVDIDKNVVARVLAKHYRPAPGGSGPSWLSFIGHATDCGWRITTQPAIR